MTTNNNPLCDVPACQVLIRHYHDPVAGVCLGIPPPSVTTNNTPDLDDVLGWRHTFIVPGMPVTQGNMRAFVVGGVARVTHKNPKGIERFRQDCRAAANAADLPLYMHHALELRLEFVLSRPLSHFGTGRNSTKLKGSAPYWHTNMQGDWDKYGRAASDALTGVCWKDDGQLSMVTVIKRYAASGEAPHTVVTYGRLAE